MREYYEYGDAAPGLALFVIVVLSLGLGAFAILTLVRARRRTVVAAEEAASLADPEHALQEGEVVLSGVVEHAAESDVAVKVEITQAGTEAESSGSWSHTWTEVDRKVTVAPFYLRLPDDTRVRIEPPRDVELADQLDGKVSISHTSRIRSAELIPDETLHAHGWLERGGDAMPDSATGYRDVTWGWVLRPAHGRMMLSSLPLGDGLRERAAFHRYYGVLAIMMLAVFQFSLLAYYARWRGDVEMVEILDRTHSTHKDSDGDIQHTYGFQVELSNAARRTFEVYGSDWSYGHKGDRIPIRAGALGSWPTLHYAHLAVSAFLVIALWLAYRSRRVSTRPWFRRQVVDSGSGRL